jgi:hypothetical protein
MTATTAPAIAAPRIDPVVDAASLLALLRRRLDLYVQLHDATRDSLTLDTPDRSAAISAALQQRQPLIDELARVDRALDPDRTGSSAAWPRMNAAELDHADALIRQTRTLHAQVFELDSHLATALRGARDVIAAELQKITASTHAANAYRAAGVIRDNNRFTNRQG